MSDVTGVKAPAVKREGIELAETVDGCARGCGQGLGKRGDLFG